MAACVPFAATPLLAAANAVSAAPADTVDINIKLCDPGLRRTIDFLKDRDTVCASIKFSEEAAETITYHNVVFERVSRPISDELYRYNQAFVQALGHPHATVISGKVRCKLVCNGNRGIGIRREFTATFPKDAFDGTIFESTQARRFH